MNQSTEDALVGRTIDGKFVIESLIGVGAMGAVYKARQIALDKVIAVKVMHPERACDAMYSALFQRESRAASRLDHPNSVRVVDFGEDPDGLLYIAMEYFAGRDLLRVLAEDWPLPANRIADILLQALAAIAVAHEMGMVHRDLKPENILVQQGKDDDGSAHDIVKVCDFGIAKFTEPSDPKLRRAEPRMTEGVVIGTPHYMSPEQGQGEALDARSDIYSMGVILYQMLTAHVPFDGQTLVDVIVKHVRDEPVPPSKHVPWVDPRLDAICLRALSKKKEERYQSAREMRADLRAVWVEPSKAEAPRPVSKSAPTLPPPDEAAKESALVQFESSLGKVTTSSVAHAKARHRGAGPALLLAMVVAGCATVWMTRSRSDAGVPSPKPASGLVAAERLVQPSTSVPKDDMLPTTPPSPLAVAPAPPAKDWPKHSASPVRRPTAPGIARHAAAFAEPSIPEAPAGIEAPAMQPTATPPPEAPPLAPPPTTAVASAPPAFDPGFGQVTWSVGATGGGATATSVRRALGRVSGAWDTCYQGALRMGGRRIEGSGVLHIATDEEGNVIQARVQGFSLPTVGPCIAASSSVRIGGVDTGSAWADVKLTFRAPTRP